MSRSTSQSSSLAGMTTGSLSRSVSVKTNNKSAQDTNLPPTSAIKLFVTNLRLLDLDLRSDWPHITVQTFSSKTADQKQRIGGVEWSLFRLFEIWDPEETAQKLVPHFPPLEPIQSVNLRAALYRCLNELKKNGVLGRETILRKTMLDECKGEKFFDVLALFSTAVLKKVFSARTRKQMKIAVARELSMATTLPSDKQSSLLPLAIAHKAALIKVLRRKEEKRRRFTYFEALLDAKAGEIHQRIKKSKATPRTQKHFVPEKDAAAIKKQLKDNWIGNQKWLDTMLHGDDVQAEDAFLNSRFEDVWPMVEQGRKLEDATPDVGLLESLQLRVQEQQSRLQKWKRFHDSLRQEEPTSAAREPKARAPTKEFKFDDHLALQLQTSEQANDEPAQRAPMRPEFQDILSDMDSELLRVSQAKHNRSVVPHLHRTTSSLSNSRSPVRRRKSHSNSALKKPVHNVVEKPAKPAPPSRKYSKETVHSRLQRHEPATTPPDSDATLVGHPSTTLRNSPPLPQPTESLVQDAHHEPIEGTSDLLPIATSPSPTPSETNHPPSLSPLPSSYWPSEPPILEPPPLNPEDALAEQIISSIGNATPSPVKKQPRLSLIERTRMSMTHTNTCQPITESESPSLPSPPLPSLPSEPAPPLDRRASLLERTRLSMAAMSQNARLQPSRTEQRKSHARQSLFPVNQFDTPRNRRSFHAIEEAQSGASTPKDDLFSDDVDYDRIFKSRPRVAQSPIFSPDEGERGERAGRAGEANGDTDGDVDGDVSGLVTDYDDDDGYDEGVTGVDLADVDAEDEDGFTQAWENSPLRRAGGGVRGKGRLFG